MARRVFYSFHYKPDNWRAGMVREIGSIEGNRPATDNDWETVKRGGDTAIKNWIANQMKDRSCTAVLVGANTANRKWINHEIVKSWDDGIGVVGIHIHGLKDSNGHISQKGRPGGRGWLPTRGSHRSGLAQLRHPAPRTMVSLLNGTHCERLAPLGEDRFCVGARSGPMSCVPGDFADQAICATAVPFHIGIGAAPGSCR